MLHQFVSGVTTRMVDTFMACEQTKSMLYRGLCQAGEDRNTLLKTVHALKRWSPATASL